MAPLSLGSGYSLTILERGGFQRIGLTGGSAKMNSTPRTTMPIARAHVARSCVNGRSGYVVISGSTKEPINGPLYRRRTRFMKQ